MSKKKKTIDDLVNQEAKNVLDDFYKRLDNECAKVLAADNAIKGDITPEKVSEAGYQIIYLPDGSAVVCKDGKPVSNVVYPNYNN